MAKTAKTAKSAMKTTNSDWRPEMMDRMRGLIVASAPGIVEEQKWKKPSNPAGVPVWSNDGIICTGETYKDYLKFTFANGADLPDPSRLFNAGLAGNMRRAIDVRKGEQVDATAFKALVKAAVLRNRRNKKKQ